ncbi:MAG: hypothetical protein COZ75_12540 [Flavobacteriaceae bacterium CG_4_8_14_3_um_filter_34_10]|nr:DUF2752 domain-containing protein [Flavobacteriia bacterium]OIP49074.1 MAG: hypothetical protein AUK33_11450 [Flavobacteriaceae bacterium CG2_30_34_30]PIQ17648.1 MAG: hypothetical protein COW66_10675 [Flavobacteriaceae bacterium CG18_big_fil_WC_8_21_14_2_50_34_36]PIV49070.1 MAG: hypothetical protein COS19_10500 [Flavobacteriaceae bacterium CG02_land_8_20_14_3_00_34_13]PIX08344.1 MAG: hypothetical protein COZ75_12540 [Flavobacteriaceae bacterium CG_4_8_14_3_um_filter_34_10]PIZ07603.1 MAG: hy
MEDYLLPCLNKKLFGIECLGCGIQRATVLLFKGEFLAAFKMYPAIYPLLLLLLFLLVNIFVKFKHDFKIKVGLIIITLFIVVVSYLHKMQILF